MTNLPTLAPQNMSEAIEFSKMIASSGMVPQNYRGKPQDILVAVQWGYEVGLQPMQAMQNIAVINGKPSVYGDAALALVKADPRCRGVKETIEGEGDNMVARCVVRRAYGDEIEETVAEFSVNDAKRAKLWGKTGPWSQYPKRMLAMRARGFAIRDAFPDAMKGMITAEEAQDYPSKTPRDVTPEPAPQPEPEIEVKQPEPEIEDDIEDAEVLPDEPQIPPADSGYTIKDHEGKPIGLYLNLDEAIGKLVDRMKLYAKTERNRAGDPVSPDDRGRMIFSMVKANAETISNLEHESYERFQKIETAIYERLGEI